MNINLRFGMHRDIEAIHDAADLIDGLVIPAHILAYQHVSTATFVCSLPGKDYLIDPMTFILQSPRERHLNDDGDVRASVAKWCDAVHPSLAKTLAKKPKKPVSPAELPAIEDLCKGMLSFQTESVNDGHIDPKAKKYIERYGLTAATQPRCIVAPYFYCTSESDPWYSVSLDCARKMKEIAGDKREVAAVIACTCDMAATSASTLAKDYGGFARVLIWVNRFNQATVTTDQIKAVRGLVAKLTAKGVQVESLYGGFMMMLMQYQDGLSAISHGILYTQDKSTELVPGSGGVPERYYIPKFHDFRSLGQANLILKKHPKLVGGTPTADRVMKGDPDRIFLFLNEPELLRRHFLEARRAECQSLASQTLAEQLKELAETYRLYHDSVRKLPNPDAVVSSSDMKGLDYLRTWASAFK